MIQVSRIEIMFTVSMSTRSRRPTLGGFLRVGTLVRMEEIQSGFIWGLVHDRRCGAVFWS